MIVGSFNILRRAESYPMLNIPMAIKVFPDYSRVVVLALIRKPNPNKLRVVRTANMLVKLQDGTITRSVVSGTARVLDVPGEFAYKVVVANFKYADASGKATDI